MPHPLRPAEIFATLAEHGVRYVVIGGLAAVLHGSPTITADADICADRSPENLQHLVDALKDLHARIRSVSEPDGIPFKPDVALLGRMKVLNLTTEFGDLDLAFVPAAFSGYEELAPDSVMVSVAGTEIAVASLDDVIRSKEVADRPKDHATLPVLYGLRDEIAESAKRIGRSGDDTDE